MLPELPAESPEPHVRLERACWQVPMPSELPAAAQLRCCYLWHLAQGSASDMRRSVPGRKPEGLLAAWLLLGGAPALSTSASTRRTLHQ